MNQYTFAETPATIRNFMIRTRSTNKKTLNSFRSAAPEMFKNITDINDDGFSVRRRFTGNNGRNAYITRWYDYPTNSQVSIRPTGNASRAITWRNKRVNTMPNKNIISLNNFRNGDKAIQYKVGTVEYYLTPTSFEKLARMPIKDAYKAQRKQFLFKNPLNRNTGVRRENVHFVILKKNSTLL